jgi:AcrR family transcriptional regulator
MSGTPRGELDRLEKARREASERVRAELESAALRGSAELGYAKLSVQAVLDRAKVSRSRFYREFDNLGACYASAYAKEIDLLSERLLSGCGDWEGGLDQALRVLQELVEENPLLARALLVEVHVAGEPAIAKKREVWERLSHALDGARRETPRPRHSPPPLTAAFMLSAIECAVCDFLLGGRSDDFAQTLLELRDLLVETYFGSD